MTITPEQKPRLFIGSSSEGVSVAKALQVELDHFAEVTLWSQGVFGLSRGTLEDLVRASREFEFAVLVLTPDDLVQKRGMTGNSPRDNVIFELGLFMGALGRDRTFIVHCREEPPQLPSDLAGVTMATFARRRDGNLAAAVGAPCTLIEGAIRRVQANEQPEIKVHLTRKQETDEFSIVMDAQNDVPFECRPLLKLENGRCPFGVPMEWRTAVPTPNNRCFIYNTSGPLPPDERLMVVVYYRNILDPSRPRPIRTMKIIQLYDVGEGLRLIKEDVQQHS